MNHIRRICRSLSGLPRRASLLTASAASAVLWADPPLPPGWNKYFPLPVGSQPAVGFPPGWNKHPPLPAHVHPLATGGIPGWQLTLMAVTVVLLAGTSVAIGYRARAARLPVSARIVSAMTASGAAPIRGGQPHGGRPYPASRPGRDGFAGRFLQDTAATNVATGQHRSPASTTMPRRRTMIAARLRPRTVQLCIQCRQNPAGFWVSHTSDQTVRRPWCLSCCQGLDPGRYHVIAFDGHGGAGRFR